MTLQKTGNFGQKNDQADNSSGFEHFDHMCKAVWSNHFDMFGTLQERNVNVSESACKSYFYGTTEPRLSTGVKILRIIDELSAAQIIAARDRQQQVREIVKYVR